MRQMSRHYARERHTEKVKRKRLPNQVLDSGGDSGSEIELRVPRLVLVLKLILAHPPAGENRRLVTTTPSSAHPTLPVLLCAVACYVALRSLGEEGAKAGDACSLLCKAFGEAAVPKTHHMSAT